MFTLVLCALHVVHEIRLNDGSFCLFNSAAIRTMVFLLLLLPIPQTHTHTRTHSSPKYPNYGSNCLISHTRDEREKWIKYTNAQTDLPRMRKKKWNKINTWIGCEESKRWLSYFFVCFVGDEALVKSRDEKKTVMQCFLFRRVNNVRIFFGLQLRSRFMVQFFCCFLSTYDDDGTTTT